jgi:phenylpyruvate tautomerase PptA (4-oxalocrotonate tautomerase family)
MDAVSMAAEVAPELAVALGNRGASVTVVLEEVEKVQWRAALGLMHGVTTPWRLSMG